MTQSAQPSLFAEVVEPEQAPAGRGPFAGVALEQAIDRILDYSIPPGLQASLRVGQRVKAPLGQSNRAVFGYVVRITDHSAHSRVKPLLAIDDRRVLLDGNLLELALWISRYYVCPLGAVIESMIPSAVKRKVGVGYLSMVRLALPRDQAQELLERTRTPKRRAVLGRMLQLPAGEAIELLRLAGEAGVKPPTIRKLEKTGWIEIEQVPDLPGFAAELASCADDETDRPLNQDQQRAFDDLRPRLAGGFSVNLLLGVTGSGKTEVYLHCIRQVVQAGRQAIVLVPEIALTPQTVKRFTARFGRVAVLHSGLGATARHRFWQQISQGAAEVVVGARSAVFAPTPRLGLIVVDEEHESSYKQDTAPRYQARDVAIKRAQLLGIPVILGSATPSLETYRKVAVSPAPGGSETGCGPDAKPATGPYFLLRLPHRVRGLSLPSVELVDLKQEIRLRRGVHLLSQRLEHLLRVTMDSGRQAILLLNRRGYANFVHCPSCQHVMQCKYCDTTLTYHRTVGARVADGRFAHGIHSGQLHCHYCLSVNALPDRCPQCGKMLSLFGLGTQRVEEEIQRKFPGVPFSRVDSDTMRSGRDYEQTLARFARGETRLLLGTQMIAKGLDYPNVTLVGIISGDTALALPDFRASERTFQLITQVAGRAGRGDARGRVVLQTFLKDEPAIRFAMRQDFEGFALKELHHRQQVGLPPFSRLVRIVVRDQDPDKLAARCDLLAADFRAAGQKVAGPITVRGPMPCPIARIAGYFRYQIVISSPSPGPLQQVLAALRGAGRLTRGERIAVDVDPVSLL
ncbi:MAG: primosomal protein N' [Phycisphaerae bacterium]|nr:primosomal protein N' [Phycisphaerae bacterium]MDW8261637.1 primosomal protein N' [Phycisphaerales bacterium]